MEFLEGYFFTKKGERGTSLKGTESTIGVLGEKTHLPGMYIGDSKPSWAACGAEHDPIQGAQATTNQQLRTTLRQQIIPSI